MSLDNLENLEISVNELRINKGKYLVIDIRDEISYNHGNISESIHLGKTKDYTEIKSLLEFYGKSKVVIYCSVGRESLQVAESLRQEGIEAYSLDGGYQGWLLESDKILDNYDIQRYSRQMLLPQIGRDGQEKIKNAKVLIVGAGGLGSPVSLYLASAGVGTIGLIDADEVNLHNLHRQIVHKDTNCNMKKVESAKQLLTEINSHVEIKTYDTFFTSDNASDLVKEYDFIIDAVDNFETKFLINDVCVLNKKPFTHGGISKFQGQVLTWVPEQDCCCYRCVFEEIPTDHIPNCSEEGVLGATAGIIGSIQALETLKYLTGCGELLTNRMYVFDGLTMNSRTVKLKKQKTCKVCGEKAEITDVKEYNNYTRKTCSLF